jgi:hypothetical protein
MGFCEKAVELMRRTDFDWELSKPLRLLCEKIFEHIAGNNPQSL